MSNNSSIFVPDEIVAIRNDCKAGQFKIGDSRFLGSKLLVSILCSPIEHIGGFYADRNDMSDSAKSRRHVWKQVWFVAAPSETNIPQGVVFPTLIKGSSISELAAFMLFNSLGSAPYESLCEMSFVPKSNDYGTYFVLSFKAVERTTKEEKAQLKLLSEFMKTEPLLYDSSLPAGIIPAAGISPEQKDFFLSGGNMLDYSVPALVSHAH